MGNSEKLSVDIDILKILEEDVNILCITFYNFCKFVGNYCFYKIFIVFNPALWYFRSHLKKTVQKMIHFCFRMRPDYVTIRR